MNLEASWTALGRQLDELPEGPLADRARRLLQPARLQEPPHDLGLTGGLLDSGRVRIKRGGDL